MLPKTSQLCGSTAAPTWDEVEPDPECLAQLHPRGNGVPKTQHEIGVIVRSPFREEHLVVRRKIFW